MKSEVYIYGANFTSIHLYSIVVAEVLEADILKPQLIKRKLSACPDTTMGNWAKCENVFFVHWRN